MRDLEAVGNRKIATQVFSSLKEHQPERQEVIACTFLIAFFALIFHDLAPLPLKVQQEFVVLHHNELMIRQKVSSQNNCLETDHSY